MAKETHQDQRQQQVQQQRQQQEQQEQQRQQQIAAAYAGIVHQIETLDPNRREIKTLSAEIYLDTTERDETEQVNKAVAELIEHLGFDVSWDLGAIVSSWFKRLFIKSKEALTHPEFARRFDEVEHGLQTYLISKHQSEIDANQADAASKVIESLAAIPNAVIKIGSLLIVKNTNSDGQTAVVVKTLTVREMVVLAKRPELLKQPAEILDELGRETIASSATQSQASLASGQWPARNSTK